MDSNDLNLFGNSNNFMPPASDSDKESTEPNHITDTDWMSAREHEDRQFPVAASDGLFDLQSLANYDHTPWDDPAFGNAFDPFPEMPLLATAAGTEGVNTNNSSAVQDEYDVNHHMPADQDHTGLQTSPHDYQQPSPSSNTPSMTDDSTRSSSNDPSTPGANELGALAPANAVAHGDAGPLPATSLASFGGNNNNGVAFGHIGIQTGYTQPFPNPWQGNLGTHSHSQGLNAAGAPAFWQPGPATTAPPPPWYTQGSYDYDAVLSSLQSPNVAPQGGAHRNARPQRRNEPYSTNQAAASGADLEQNNTISTGAAPAGGARSNGAGRTTLSPPRTTKKKASRTAKKSSTTAKGSKWMCEVEGCPGKRCKERGPNNEPLFASKQCFENHMKTHARDSKAVGNSGAGKGSEPVEGWKPVICPDCHKKLESGRKDSLTRHLKSKTACKGKKDAEKKDASAPDERPSNLHKHDDGDEDDDQGFGGMGGMSTGMPQALGQAGLSTW